MVRLFHTALSAVSSIGLDPDLIHRFLTELSTGNQDRVFRTGAAAPWDLNAVENPGGADLDVHVTEGLYVVSGIPAHTEGTQIITFLGSTGNYDIIQGNSSGVLSRKTGTAVPGATSPDTNNIILFEIFDDDAIVINANITDKRVFS